MKKNKERVKDILENAEEWGWSLESPQDCTDAAFSYCNDLGDLFGWEDLAEALEKEVSRRGGI